MKSKFLPFYLVWVICYYLFFSNAQVFGCVTQIEVVRFDGGAYLDAATLGVCPYTGPINTGYCKAAGSVLNTSITTSCSVCGWGSDMDAMIWYDFDKDGIQDAGEIFPMNSCGVNTCYFYDVTIPTWVSAGPMNITIYTSFYGPIYEYTTYRINIGTIGTPAIPSGTLARCQGAGTSTYTIPPVTGATSYTWTLTPAAAGTITGTGTTGTVTWNAAFSGSATVGVQAVGPCGTSTQSTVNVTVNGAPGMPSAPAGTLTRCQGAGTSAYTTTATGATGYTWTLTPAAAGGISGTGTTGTVTWNAGFSGTATVSVTAVNACGTAGPVSTTVTVNSLPGMPSAPAGTLTRCQGAGTSAYTTTATGATGYTWTLTPAAAGGISGTGTTGTVTWNAGFSGTATVSVTAVNACGTAGPVTTNVTVNPLPGMPSAPAGTLTRCQGAGTSAYTTTATGATGYTWTLTPAAAGGISGTSTTGTVTWNAAFAGTATVSVTAVNACGTTGPVSTTVTVNAPPGTPAAPSGTLTRCQGAGTSAYTTTATGATGYTWTLTPAAAGGISGTGTTGTVTWNAAFSGTATVSVTAVNACGTAGPVSTTVTVNAPSAGTATWIGGVSNNWFTPQNWSTCSVPTCATNVIINEVTAPNVHPVIASGTAACQNLTINGGPPPVNTLLTISAGATLDICGNYTHNSGADNVSYSGSSTIRFVGSSPQTYNVLSGGVTFGSVHINNGSTVTISGANMNLSASPASQLRLASGRIITGANLVQVQNNTLTAVYDHSVNSYVQGNLRRYVADGGPYDFPVGDAPISLGGKGYQLAHLTFPPGGRNNSSQTIDRVIGRFDPVTIPMSPSITATCPMATTPEPPLNNGRWTLTAQTTGNVNVTATGFNYNLTLFPLPGSYSNNKTYATIMRDGSATMGVGTCNPGNAVSHTRSSMTGFSQFEIAQGEVPMPADGIFLTGTRNQNSVWLDWIVIAPRQVSGYQVERKIEATQTDFVPIAFVNANEPLTFKDLDVPSGKLSYRIAAIDHDGTRSLSNVVEISESSIAAIKLYPNPVEAGDPVFIEGIEQSVNEAEFIDVTGKVWKTPVTRLTGGKLLIPTAGKPAGVYLIKTGNNMILKLIIQ